MNTGVRVQSLVYFKNQYSIVQHLVTLVPQLFTRYDLRMNTGFGVQGLVQLRFQFSFSVSLVPQLYVGYALVQFSLGFSLVSALVSCFNCMVGYAPVQLVELVSRTRLTICGLCARSKPVIDGVTDDCFVYSSIFMETARNQVPLGVLFFFLLFNGDSQKPGTTWGTIVLVQFY